MDKSELKKNAYFGNYGGCFVPESLIAHLIQLNRCFLKCKDDPQFLDEFNELLTNFAGRPTPLTELKRYCRTKNGPRIFLKREDLLHTGAHKINNVLGQALLAKRMKKTRMIAETGAGQHGVATATACALLNLECTIYMGIMDMERQAPNVERMRLLGAEVIGVDAGSKTLKDAVNEALRDIAETYEYSHYCLGSALGPYPYPTIVAFFHRIIGKETKQQCQERTGQMPNLIVACLGGGSNSIGIFSEFISDPTVKMVAVEAGGFGDNLGEHAARFKAKTKGVLHGTYTYLLQDENGQVSNTHSISAGLDYPAVGPQHAALYEEGRVLYTSVSDSEALKAFKDLTIMEGIIPALESAHALAYLEKVHKDYSKDQVIVINLSGRGDKDLPKLFQDGLI